MKKEIWYYPKELHKKLELLSKKLQNKLNSYYIDNLFSYRKERSTKKAVLLLQTYLNTSSNALKLDM
ncbi:MAG: hypothetical protein ACK5HL_04585 [Bacilli bacterium]